MKDLTNVILQLKDIKGEVTYKDLCQMGLNQYFVKKLEDEGILYKVGRGKYEYSGIEGIDLSEETPLNSEANLQQQLTSKTQDESSEILQENIPNSISSYIDEDKYQKEMRQIDSLIEEEMYKALGIYIIGASLDDEKRLFDLETYAVERLYGIDQFEKAEVFCKDLNSSKTGATMVLRIKYDKEND